MPKQIDSEKVIERINERINSLPQSRIELGGFHTGQLAAYQNIIDDLRASTFDPTPVQPDTEEGEDWSYHSKTSIPEGALNKYRGRDIYVYQKEHPVHGKLSFTVLATDQDEGLRIIKDVMSRR